MRVSPKYFGLLLCWLNELTDDNDEMYAHCSKAGASASNVDNLLNSRLPGSRASTPPTPGMYGLPALYVCWQNKFSF